MKEITYYVQWEGPFDWEKQDKPLHESHVLYQIYGTHHLYGHNVLLYIGSTTRIIDMRLKEHDWWAGYGYDKTSVCVGFVNKFTSWEAWKTEDYPSEKTDPKLVKKIEALLIYAHQTVYNSKNKSSLNVEGIRVFNTGRSGQLFPEVSYKYYWW